MWNRGFVDMSNYWGNRNLGNRKSFGYVPQIYGNLFYKAHKMDPLLLNGRSISTYKDLIFLGYRLEDKRPVFIYQADANKIEMSVRSDESEYSALFSYKIIMGTGSIDYEKNPQCKVVNKNKNEISVAYKGALIEIYELPKEKSDGKPSVGLGKTLYENLGCMVCHSLDGAKGHGPSFKNLAGSMREFVDGSKAVADDEYLEKSIMDPNHQVVKDFPPNFMPPFKDVVKPYEIKSLILYIKAVEK